MGIPGLTRKAEEHAERAVYETQASANRQAILDGPALAYHVLNLRICHREYRLSPFDDMPTYQELSSCTIAWLTQLRRHGFEIKSIIFDGHLPSWKKTERSSRSQQAIDGLVKVKATRQDYQLGRIAPPISTPLDHSIPLSYSKLKNMAAPPNFISAVLDGLFESPYASVTKVVPGEADSYCAEVARDEHVPFIFTGDSDLLVQDLGPNGKVVMFKDVDFDPAGDGSMKILEHCPAQLAHVLQVPDLISTAYYAKQDRYRSLLEAASLARAKPPSGPAYGDFRDLYTSHGEVSKLMAYLGKLQHDDVVAFLEQQDSRVSELILQLQLEPLTTSTALAARDIFFYLPYLIEDPSKSSAFQPSAGLLKLAYSVLKFVDPTLNHVVEYARRGREVVGVPIAGYAPSQTVAEIADLVEWLGEASSTYDCMSDASRWRMISTVVLIDNLKQKDKPMPLAADMVALILNDVWPTLSWSLIHTRAQVQGILFSLRLIRQVTDILLKISEHVKLRKADASALHSLRAVLLSLPKTADILDWKDATKGRGDRRFVATILDRLMRTGEEDTAQNGFEKPKLKRKQMSKTQTMPSLKPGSLESVTRGLNQFSLLADSE